MRLPRKARQPTRAPSPGERFERLTGLRLGNPEKLWNGGWNLAWDNGTPEENARPVYMRAGGAPPWEDPSVILKPGEGPAPDCDPVIAAALSRHFANRSRRANAGDISEMVEGAILAGGGDAKTAKEKAGSEAKRFRRERARVDNAGARRQMLRDVAEQLAHAAAGISSVWMYPDAGGALRSQDRMSSLRRWTAPLHVIREGLLAAADMEWPSPPRRKGGDWGNIPEAEALRWFVDDLRNGPFAPKTRRGARRLSAEALADLLVWSGMKGLAVSLEDQVKAAIRWAKSPRNRRTLAPLT